MGNKCMQKIIEELNEDPPPKVSELVIEFSAKAIEESDYQHLA